MEETKPTCEPPSPPSNLARLFYKVPSVADLIVYELTQQETEKLMVKTEAAIYRFCLGPGGGIYRCYEISEAGYRKRSALRRLPSLPRLLAGEWQKKLMGKRLIREDAEGDDMTFKKSDIPWPNRIGCTSGYCNFNKNRLNIRLNGKPPEVTWVSYG